ncbi:protein turtle homolog B isoform X2 [Parasteatoda tepidariorum]|uniref:protein turtle homolog B isoform X2 n=1 Tax=Parasteatoda tepidariorum TaxID=114398 RepID=UPI001C71B110|nr:hemicentin-2 isoform X2 [Parasteatoda tepidariorum]
MDRRRGCRYSSWMLLRAALCLHLLNFVLNVLAMPELWAVAGRRASLPCNLSEPEDSVTLILWYKGETKAPIYTLDARKGSLEKARHFPSTELGARANFDMSADPPTLDLNPVHAEDDGVYKCRIEFKRSRTLTQFVRLHVIVPVREVIIMDEHGQRLRDVIGPYDEGSYVSLICEAEGGIPHPIVTWWRESVLVDDSYSQTSQGYVRNELALPKLHRNDLMMTYSCQAANTNLTVPVTASITIDINLKPLDVRITSIQRPFSAGRKIQLFCESSGARPRAQLTWWLDNKRIQAGKETFSDNLTSTSLNFLPKAEDNGKILSCRAQNPSLSNSAIEDGWTLTVYFVPELKLFLGANIQADAIKEGTDVFFECNVKANPWVNEVKWRFEGYPLYGNTTAGIIVSNHSLVLQRVRKEHRGSYQCIAVNTEGEGRSDEVMLKVKYAPVCRHAGVTVHGVARYEALNVSCEVEADPPQVKFKWSLNNTVENVDIPPQSTNMTVSTITYTPRTMLGYGALLCWAQNSIGHQKDPCLIRIIPAGPPESVKSCVVSNQSVSFLLVECEAGYDGGMKQSFHLEVYNSAVEHLQANESQQDMPVFQVGNLPAATSFILVLYASNAKGRSNSVALMTNTLMPAERRTDKETTNDPKEEVTNISPILAVLIGIVAVLVILAIVIIIIMRRQGTDPEKRPPTQENIIKCDMPLKKDTDEIPDSTVESPDVIPNTNESQVYISDTGEITEKDEMTYEFLKSRDYSYDYITAVRSKKQHPREDEITYAELSHKEAPCSVVNRIQPPTEYAELDFQRRLAYPWPASVREEAIRSSLEAGEFPLIGGASNKSKESLHIPETTTETTPL